MEIDSRDWMWILDVGAAARLFCACVCEAPSLSGCAGRLNIFDAPSSIINLQPKLVVYDLTNGCVVRVHRFPDAVLPSNNSFANDIVVDETRGLACESPLVVCGQLCVCV